MDRRRWFYAAGGDLSQPLANPGGTALPNGMARYDGFREPAMGTRWSLYASAPTEKSRLRIEDGALRLASKGPGPHDSSPLTQQVGDRAYEISVEVELKGAAAGGLLLFFNDRLYLGMGIDGERMISYRGGKASHWRQQHGGCTCDRQRPPFRYWVLQSRRQGMGPSRSAHRGAGYMPIPSTTC